MNSTLSPRQLESLENDGYVVVETSKIPLGQQLINISELRKLSKRLYQQQYFKTATIGALKNTETTQEIRNDFTLWIDAEKWPQGLTDSETETLKKYCRFLTQTQETLRNYFRLSLNSYETHFAIYPKGHFYKKHVDQTAQNNHRYFSFVLYLNEDWSLIDGGNLVGYKDQNKIFDILPKGHNFIVFQSSIEHEVLPTLKERYSITGWFRND